VNGTAGSGNWHDGANELADDGYTPFFVAKNFAQKYLNYENGYKLLAPVQKGPQSGGNFTMGTLTLSAKASNETANTITPKQPVAFQLEEGQLSVEVDGESAQLIQRDGARDQVPVRQRRRRRLRLRPAAEQRRMGLRRVPDVRRLHGLDPQSGPSSKGTEPDSNLPRIRNTTSTCAFGLWQQPLLQ